MRPFQILYELIEMRRNSGVLTEPIDYFDIKKIIPHSAPIFISNNSVKG